MCSKRHVVCVSVYAGVCSKRRMLCVVCNVLCVVMSSSVCLHHPCVDRVKSERGKVLLVESVRAEYSHCGVFFL